MNLGDPVLHLIVGPNGAGKSTFFRLVVAPETALPFVNADEIAAARWPGEAEAHSYDAARLAAQQWSAFIAARRSFAAETCPRILRRSNCRATHAAAVTSS